MLVIRNSQVVLGWVIIAGLMAMAYYAGRAKNKEAEPVKVSAKNPATGEEIKAEVL